MAHHDALTTLTKRNLLRELAEPMTIAGRTIGVTASIGLGVYPEHSETGDALMRAADVAMYRAKTAGNALTMPSEAYPLATLAL